MAIFNVKVRRHKASPKATAAGYASYVERARYDQYVTRDGLAHNKAEDLIHTESRNLPSWADQPQDFWKAVDRHTPLGRMAYTEIVIALPKEFSDAQNIQLTQSYLNQTIGEAYPVTVGIHRPDAANGEPHPHAHIVLNTRRTDLREVDGNHKPPEQFFKYHRPASPATSGAVNDSKAWGRKSKIYELRKAWADTLNPALKAAGIKQAFDYKRDYETEYRKIHLTKGEFRDLQQRVEKLETVYRVKLWGQERHLTPEMMTQLRESGMTERQAFKLERRSDLDAMNEVKGKIQDVVNTYRTERSKELTQGLNPWTQSTERGSGNTERSLSQAEYVDMRNRVAAYEKQTGDTILAGTRQISQEQLAGLAADGMSERQLHALRESNSTWSSTEWEWRKGMGSSEFDRTPDFKSLIVKVQAALGDDGADRGMNGRRHNRFETVEDRTQQREQSRGLER